MQKLKSLPSTEPVALGTLILAVIGATLILLQSFGLNLTEGQYGAIMEWAGALIGLLAFLGVGTWMRSRVTPVAKLEDDEQA